MSEVRPRGRRAGGEDVAPQIVAAARAEFTERGYAAASLRGIARSAGVDPRLVRYYFPGGKDELFAAAMADRRVDPQALVTRLLEGPPEELGDRLVRLAVTVWDQPGAPERFRTLMAATAGGGDRLLREFLGQEIFGRVRQQLVGPDAERRTGLAASQVVGLLVSRHVLRLEPVASLTVDELVRWMGPVVQAYVDGRDLRGPAGSGEALAVEAGEGAYSSHEE